MFSIASERMMAGALSVFGNKNTFSLTPYLMIFLTLIEEEKQSPALPP